MDNYNTVQPEHSISLAHVMFMLNIRTRVSSANAGIQQINECVLVINKANL